MKFILGTKIGMTQVFRNDGSVVPVTRVQAGPCVVTQIKNGDTNGVQAVQIGFGTQKLFRVNKAQQGHLKDLPTVRVMRDFRVPGSDNLKRGDMFDVTTFVPGDRIQVTGTSKGRGFQGVVKRHGFAGGPASHGHKDNLRMPGSIGAGGVQRVFKGMRMGGHMGDAQITIQNLEVVEVHLDTNELFIKGAVPGARGGLLLISTENGVITVTGSATEQPVAAKQEEVAVEPVEATEVVAEEATPAEEPTK